jgi:hypothetical protein
MIVCMAAGISLLTRNMRSLAPGQGTHCVMDSSSAVAKIPFPRQAHIFLCSIEILGQFLLVAAAAM